MPQAVTPEKPTTTSVLKESTSAQVSMFGVLFTGLVKGVEYLFSVAKDTGAEAAINQQSMSGLSALISFIGLTPTSLALVVVTASLLVVLQRRIMRDKA